MIGRGKYDALCTLVRERAHATGAIVIVFEGSKGNGFSAQLPFLAYATIVETLRTVADDIERDGIAAGGGRH